MKFIKYFVILGIIALSGGCIEQVLSGGQTSPVMYATVVVDEISINTTQNVKLNESSDNAVVVKSIELYGGEMPKLKAPKENLADRFPAVYIRVVQRAGLINYQTGAEYKGPGIYNFTVGFKEGLDKNNSMNVIVRTFNESGTPMFSSNFVYNWSENKQSKTFK